MIFIKKYLHRLIISLFCLSGISCGFQTEISYDQLDIESMNDVRFYKKDAQPYTGFVYRDSLSFRVEEFTVHAGLQNGDLTSFYPNGQLKSRKFYKDGKLNGLVEYFTETGLRMASFNFSAGKKAGNQYKYYPSGILEEVTFFDKGVLKGENIFYFEDGKIRQRIQFNEFGQRSGKWTKFYSNGKLKESIEFKEGKLISPVMRYDVSGKRIP